MRYEFNELFWGDSTIEKIVIQYDYVVLSIFNDVLQRTLDLKCFNCLGISAIPIWDEIIIDNVIFSNFHSIQNSIWKQLYDVHNLESFVQGKNLNTDFWEIKVILVDKLSFSVFCQKFEIWDSLLS